MCLYSVLRTLDTYMVVDKNSRTAIEVMGGHNIITINGEVISTGKPDLENIAYGLTPRGIRT